ncbi:hypothetical protein [Catellatospora methionotrophica]|uniref:hypothetical protein n=1 Tax=Catellatospora methionotrophica TaxID=121620 RepID=UPI0033D5E8EA
MTLPIDPYERRSVPGPPPPPNPVARPPMSWWRRHRVLRNWLAGVASAVAVSVISGVVLAIVTPTTDPPGGTATSPAAPDQPFTVDVLSRGEVCLPYVVDADPASLASPHRVASAARGDRPSDDEVVAWMGKVGAVPSKGNLVLTVQGVSGKAVVLQGLEVEIVERSPAPAAPAVFIIEDGCGAEESPRLFDIVLDQPNPQAKPQDGVAAGGAKIPAASFPFSVSDSDPEIFLIEANPGRCDCTWRLRLRWVGDGRSGTLVIDDHGKPFRTSGYDEPAAQVYYERTANNCPSDVTWCLLPS